jgi:hypothetical protein
VTEDDKFVNIGMSGPAVLSNKFTATTDGLFMRIAFLEGNGGITEEKFRSAVVVTLDDALALAGLIHRLANKSEVMQ